jgi:PhzF family phenazine biosynthesis protein
MRIFQIDAFAEAAFTGNPAAVCLLEGRELDASWMQSVAAEMNLSETAFLRPQHSDWSLRWFTPAVEVALCGHATLASAHALFEELLVPLDGTVRFHTLSGVLTATHTGDGLIDMNFPVKRATPALAADGLLEALSVKAVNVLRNDFDYLIEVATELEVRALEPNYRLLRTVPVRGVAVTSRAASPGFDFVSRFFAPAAGVDEDPVTGSAHCALGPYWASRLGKTELTAYQASRRGGIVRVRVDGDRVHLAGRAVTIFRGDLRV